MLTANPYRRLAALTQQTETPVPGTAWEFELEQDTVNYNHLIKQINPAIRLFVQTNHGISSDVLHLVHLARYMTGENVQIGGKRHVFEL